MPPGAPLDASVFDVAKDRRMPPASAISSLERHKLKQRIWHVGNMLMKMHNCLQPAGGVGRLDATRGRPATRVEEASPSSRGRPPPRVEGCHDRLRGEFIALSPLLRKCFVRIKYILSDDINANVDENAILGQHDDDDSDSPPAPEDAAAEAEPSA